MHSEEKMGMITATPQSFSVRCHRLRWVLYVVLALVGGSLTFVGAHAQQKASEEATFGNDRQLCAAWSSANPDNAAKFYAKDEGLVFYDLAPFFLSRLAGISRRSAEAAFR